MASNQKILTIKETGISINQNKPSINTDGIISIQEHKKSYYIYLSYIHKVTALKINKNPNKTFTVENYNVWDEKYAG